MPSETQALFLVKMKIARPKKAKRQNRVKYIPHSSGVSNWASNTIPILPTMRLPRKPIKKSRIFLAVVCVPFKGLFSSLFIKLYPKQVVFLFYPRMDTNFHE